MTVGEAIEMLRNMPHQDAQVYFDCAHCNAALEFHAVREIVLVETQVPKVKREKQPTHYFSGSKND